MKFEAVLFDFDGTVADTSEGILESIAYALECMDRPALPIEQARRFIGPPLLHSFQAIAGLSEQDAQRAVELYREHYEKDGGLYKLRFYDGLLPLAAELQHAGVRTGIASAKPDLFIHMILRHYHADSYFDCAKGITMEECCTDKTAVIRSVIDTFRVQDTKRVLMVGDTLYDVEGAINAGASAAAVLYGFGDAQALRSSGAVCCAESVAALRRYLFESETDDV